MDLRVFLILLPIYFSLRNCYGVASSELSINEAVQIKNQLEFLNQPGVEIIQTIHGDNYICVDFYKQPAFEHPLLKNHSYHYEMKPNSYPKSNRTKGSSQNIEFSNLWSNGKGCPRGTVPIRKMTKNELIKAYRISKMFQSPTHELTPSEPGIHFAGLRTRPYNNYNGGGASLGIFAPKVAALQFSGSQIKIQADSDYIQCGWMVNPNLNSDSLSRNFIFTKTNKLYCFNLLCPAFVLVRSDVPIDFVLTPNAETPVALQYIIHKDSTVENGDWMLTTGINRDRVGFWPAAIFTALGGSATHIEWAGEVYSPTGIPSPQMGNGFPKRKDTKYDSFSYDLVTVDWDHYIVKAEDLEPFSANFSVYGVYEKQNENGWGPMFFYGGEGGLTGN